jgi:hypothetical protein
MVPANGGTPVAIAPLDHYAGNCGGGNIVFDATYVYWNNYADATIWRATLAGAGPTQIYNGGQYMNGFAIDPVGGSLFFHQYPNTSIGRVSTSGTNSTTFATTGSINGQGALATDGMNLYWADSSVSTVNQVPFSAVSLPASPTVLASGETLPQAPFVTSSAIYWVSAYTAGALRYASLASPSPASLATGLVSPTYVVVDASYAYVLASGASASDGRVYRVPVAGGAPVIIASGLYQPTALAMDAGHLYWAQNNTSGNQDGTVMVMPKCP